MVSLNSLSCIVYSSQTYNYNLDRFMTLLEVILEENDLPFKKSLNYIKEEAKLYLYTEFVGNS